MDCNLQNIAILSKRTSQTDLERTEQKCYCKIAVLLCNSMEVYYGRNCGNIIPMLLFPIIILYLFEWYTHNPFTTMKIRIQLLNIVLFELIMALLLFLFGKLKTALRCQTILFMIIGLAELLRTGVSPAPIMPWDILSIGTAASVANNFKYTLSKEAVFVLIGFVILILLESKVTLELKKDWRIRVGGVLASFALLWGFTAMLHQDSTVARFKLYDKLFTPTVKE